jgi:soluble lytic murein transglycosylase
VKPARSATLIDEDAKAYVRARWRVKTFAFDAGIKELGAIKSKLFEDRIHLLSGQAYEARRNLEASKRAYLEAVETSVSPAVSEAALRGLISVTGKLGDYQAQLGFLDALIDSLADPAMSASGRPTLMPVKAPDVVVELPDPALELLRVNALIKVGRPEDAVKRIWAILDSWPDRKRADTAEKLLVQIQKRRIDGDERARIALAKAHYWMRVGRHRRGIGALAEARAAAPRLATEIDLEMADAHRQHGSRSAGEGILLRLAARKDLGELRSEVLLRLGRVATDRYQYPRARALFTQVISEFPWTPAAAQSAYEAAQVEYDTGDYALAARKMLAIEGGETTPELARSALWMAGWSAYLSQTSSLAIANLERLLASDPDPELRDRAQYWLARTHERAEHWQAATDAYRDVASRSPFRYYGLWSRAHLIALHVPVRIRPPARIDLPSSVENLVAELGPDRLINIDRAVILTRANMRQEGVEELLAAVEHYRRTRNRLGMTVVVDLFRLFDREAWASLIARYIADESPEQPNREPYFWRIWRYAYPTPFGDEVERASNAHYVDPFLTYAVMRTESRFRPDAVSPVGARGLMQLMPATARWIARITPSAKHEAARYRAPGPNIWLGSWYLRDLVDRFGANAVHVIGAYNAGPGAMDRWIKRFGVLSPDEFAERVPYYETRAYIRRTLESFMIYHVLYDPPPPMPAGEDSDREG